MKVQTETRALVTFSKSKVIIGLVLPKRTRREDPCLIGWAAGSASQFPHFIASAPISQTLRKRIGFPMATFSPW